jgi:hypothetical protein
LVRVSRQRGKVAPMSNLRECECDHRVMTTKDVVQASKVVIKSGDFPVRVVLRQCDTGGRMEFVVHTELLKMDLSPDRDHLTIALRHEGFQQGSYCQTYERALEVFKERAAKL